MTLLHRVALIAVMANHQLLCRHQPHLQQHQRHPLLFTLLLRLLLALLEALLSHPSNWVLKYYSTLL